MNFKIVITNIELLVTPSLLILHMLNLTPTINFYILADNSLKYLRCFYVQFPAR